MVIQQMDPCCYLVCSYDVILYYDIKNIVIITEIRLDEICKNNVLFSHISHKPQAPIQFLLLQTLRAFYVDSSYIKSLWIVGCGDRYIDDEMYAKMQIFSYLIN